MLRVPYSSSPQPLQAPNSTRQKDKFVPLPNGSSNALNLLVLEEGVEVPLAAADDNYLPSHYGRPGTAFSSHKPGSADLLRMKLQPYRGRITVYCIAETLDRRSLIALLAASFPTYTVTQYSDVVHVEVPDAANQPGMSADAFFFEYGVVALWGMAQSAEADVIAKIARGCERGPLPPEDVDIDL
ncbi:MAG: hypothetical protein WDW38_001295 [Sanguina aurantia]